MDGAAQPAASCLLRAGWVEEGRDEEGAGGAAGAWYRTRTERRRP